MGNKEDWEEIERWHNEKNENDKLKYMHNVLNIDEEETKVKKFVKVLSVAGKGLKVGGIIVAIVVAFILITIISMVLANMKSSFYVDVKKDIETSHFCKIKLISKDVVETYGYNNENGKYYFEIKKCPSVKFTVIKDGGKDYDDYDENLQKYLFDNWNSSEKNNFKTEEYIEINGILYYRNYIEIENYSELIQATENIIHFMEYAEKWNNEHKIINNYHQKEYEFFVAPMGMTFIKVKDEVINPYCETYITTDKIKENAIEQFNQLSLK